MNIREDMDKAGLAILYQVISDYAAINNLSVAELFAKLQTILNEN